MRFLAILLALVIQTNALGVIVIENVSTAATLSAGDEAHTLGFTTTAGRTLVMVTMGFSSRTYDWTSSAEGAMTTTAGDLVTSTGINLVIHYKVNITGGDTTLTSDINTSTGSRWVKVFELSGVDNADAVDQISSIDTYGGSDVTDHPCAASGEIDTAANVFVISIGRASSVTTTTTQSSDLSAADSSGYDVVDATNGRLFQWGIYSSPQTDLDMNWTSGVARSHAGVIASFNSIAGGGGVAVDPLSKTITGSPTAINPIPSGF